MYSKASYMEYKSNHIEALMLSLQDERQAACLSRFFKTGPGQYGEGDKFLGIKVPVTRDVVKAEWKGCNLVDVDCLLHSEYHGIRLCALLILVRLYRQAKNDPEMQKHIVDFYLASTERINNWDLVDLSCYEIIGPWLMDKDRTVLYDLARNGRTIWEQRIAIVSCMAFVRKGQLDDCFAIADILLHHEHDLIHKAVGWLLRDAGKKDDQALKDFLAPRYRTMPRTMLRYAIEKFPEEERQKYLRGEA